MDTKLQIRTDRVVVSIPLRVSGAVNSGRSFSVEAKTARISRDGATIVLPHELPSGREIRICRMEGGEEVPARVAGFLERNGELFTFGVVFTDSPANLWGAEFPEGIEPGSAPTSIFLECAACSTRATVELNDIQAEVFMARGIISLPCSKCDSWTVWALATHESSATPNPQNARLASASARKNPAENRRKHLRVSTKVMASISYAGFRDEVVRVKDASRGGFRFVSPCVYPEGAVLLVAVPYTRDAANNVFVPARIMWRKELVHLDRREYGVAYAEPGKSPFKS